MTVRRVCKPSWWLIGAVAASLWLVSTGCSVDGYARDAQFTHWHDDETIVLVYNRKQTLGGLSTLFQSQPETTHVRICTIEDDNSLDCRDQRRLTNMLNPQLSDSQDLADPWELE